MPQFAAAGTCQILAASVARSVGALFYRYFMQDEQGSCAGPGVDFTAVVGARPHYAAALRDLEEAVWTQNLLSPVILELCRLRIAQLLDCTAAFEHRTQLALAAGLDESLVNSLTRWPTDARFDNQSRACLGYAEQILIDAQEVGDELAHSVVAEIGERGFLVLTYACGLFETTQRARLILNATRW